MECNRYARQSDQTLLSDRWPLSSSAPPYLSVVVPCFDEEDSLREVHRRLTQICAAVGKPFEIVLINDGSNDRTWPLMLDLAQADASIVALNLSRNFGHQVALSAGLSISRGERVLIIDADLQDPPELLPRMLELMDAGADVVYGQRRSRAGETVLKRATAAGFYRLLASIADGPIVRDAGDFRLLSRRALDVLLQLPERHRFVRGMVSWIGFRQEPIEYDRAPRWAGSSKYRWRRMVTFAVDAITAFSTRPLALAYWASGVAAGTGILTAISCLWLYLLSSSSPAWLFLLAVILMVASAQFLVLGILGAYVGRSYAELLNRPLFVIQDIRRGGACGSVVKRESSSEAYRQASTVTSPPNS